MKKYFFVRNLVMFMIPIIVPLLILGVFYIIFAQQNVLRDIDRKNMSTLIYTKQSVEAVVRNIDDLCKLLNSNVSILEDFCDVLSEDMNFNKNKNSEIVENIISTYSKSYQCIHSIYLYLENEEKNFYYSERGICKVDECLDKSWFNTYIGLKYESNENSMNFYTELRDISDDTLDGQKIKLITVYKKLSFQNQGIPNGVLVINILPESIEQQLELLKREFNESILILNNDNNVIFRNGASKELHKEHIEKILEEIKNPTENTINIDNSLYAAVQISNISNWKYVIIVSLNDVYKSQFAFVYYIAILSAISFIISIILAYYVTRQNYKQIEKIISVIEAAENDSELPPMPSRVKDAYGYIIYNVLKVFIEQRYLKMQLLKRKYLQKSLELLALQTQINPHFLFNTLETINWKTMALTGRYNDSNEMIEYLTDILKYSLSDYKKMVEFSEEIKYTKIYIKIQEIRFKDEFEFIWDYDDDVARFPVIKLIIQPLLENSFTHGIRKCKKKNKVRVRCFEKNSVLYISIVDNGCGMSREKLMKIRKDLGSNDDLSEHIGLFNTNRRIVLIYGEEYRIHLRSKLNWGTAIYLRIPYRRI